MNFNLDVNALAAQAGEALTKIAEQAGTTGTQLLTIAVHGTRIEGFVHLVWASIGFIGLLSYAVSARGLWKLAWEKEKKNDCPMDSGFYLAMTILGSAVWIIVSLITFGVHTKPAIIKIFAPEYSLMLQAKEAVEGSVAK